MRELRYVAAAALLWAACGDDPARVAPDTSDTTDTAADAPDAGDTGTDGSGDVGELPPPTFAVDETLVLVHASHPGLEDGAPGRPVARVEDGSGRGAEFVANELIVATDDGGALAALLDRWDGEVIAEFVPDDEALAELPTISLVRVDAPSTDLDALAADLAALEVEGTGELRVSSEQGLALVATAAGEAAAGLAVGLNWIGDGDARFLDDTSREAPSADGIDGYQSNAFDWPFLSGAATQGIGVPEAWRAMELAGRLDGTVGVAILDMGFSIEGDLPAGTESSNVPFVFGIDDRASLGSCGSPCPWHGTSVAAAAFGVPDDNNGTAGPAGPIARPIYVFTFYDFFTSISAVGAAAAAGARVVNMSYSAEVPAVLGFTVWPFELTTRIVRGAGVLLFASAGNAGKNVDGQDCFLGICWEHTWHTPCENAGVLCIGGLGWDSIERAENSNFGREHVDLYAPYTVWTGPDPSAPDNEARWINGTSFSSPYAAGAAALIWAADPSQSADQVEQRLLDFARADSPDDDVELYINVYDAVRDALGTSHPPYVEITAPASGGTFGAGLPGVTFTGIAEDLEDGVIPLEWSSDRDGALGTGTSLNVSDLSPGAHTISASAVDSAAARTTRTITLTIENEAPTVGIEEPLSGARFFVGETVTFLATSFDPNEPGFELTGAQLAWSSSRDGAFGTGVRLETAALTEGSHTVTLTGTDSGGLTDTDTVTVWIDPEPVDQPPVVAISSPADESEFFWDGFDSEAGHWYYDITLIGTATDEEDGALTGADLVWTTDQTTYQPAQLGTGATLSTRLYGDCFGTTHTIRLTATDSGGNVRSAVIRVLVWTLC